MAHEHNHEHNHTHSHESSSLVLTQIIITAIALIAMQFIHIYGTQRLICFLAIYIIIGWNIIREAFENIFHGEIFDENFLMLTATIGVFILATYFDSGDYNEAIAVLLFFQIGEFFQSYAVKKSRQSISNLMNIRPDYANLYTNKTTKRVHPDYVKIGSTIIIQPGERIPLDGIILEGESTINTSALTGESTPRNVSIGDEILSGCINMTGVIYARTTKEFKESTVSKIIDLVETSNKHKANSERFITRFAHYYTPIVCLCALLLAIVPPLIQVYTNPDFTLQESFTIWIYRALTFLVISCPCALVISIPLSFFAAIGTASKYGILIKGADYIEKLSKLKTIIFDKTGTLTMGVFDVTNIIVSNKKYNENQILEYAAYAESSSSHPIAKSIIKKYNKEINLNKIKDVQEVSGMGICANIDGMTVVVGNNKIMNNIGIDSYDSSILGTVVHIAINKQYAGYIILGDIIRSNAATTIQELKNNGISRIVMLTGDNTSIAEQVAKEINIQEVHSNLLPTDKVNELNNIIQNNNDICAFVGDGINDAPVLNCATIGIAMGAMGSDAAIEAADVVLMDDDISKVCKAQELAKKCMNIVWQNIAFAIGIKIICLILGAWGIANMWMAVFADVGVLIIAILNAIRPLLQTKLKDLSADKQAF